MLCWEKGQWCVLGESSSVSPVLGGEPLQQKVPLVGGHGSVGALGSKTGHPGPP